MIANIGMKLSTHTYYVTPVTLNWFPWQPPTITNSLRPFSLKSLLHISNLPTIVHMEMKLCAHVYFIVSMTTVNKKCPQALFPITTPSLLKLANHTIHGGETWYVCVFQRFHYDHEQKWPQAITTSSLLKLANHAIHGSKTWYACVFQRFHNNHEQKFPQALFLISLLKLANHSGEICTQVYLSISMMSSSLRHSISILFIL